MEYGIVYLLTNPVIPGLVKIGMMTANTDKRIQHRRHPTNKHETEKFKQRLAKV